MESHERGTGRFGNATFMGIGRAVASLLSRNGFRVFGTTRQPSVTGRSGDVEWVGLDVRDEQSVSICVNGSELVGVQAASRHFFSKDPIELAVPEAALLAGLVRTPAYYSPAVYPERARARRNEVLDLMASRRDITPEEAEAARSAPLHVAEH